MPVLRQCLSQVRPWRKTEPVRALVLIHCYDSAINGAKEDVDAQLNRLDPGIVAQILIRHCPTLEMAPIIQQFSQMPILKVYNSSITERSADSALTHMSHPNLSNRSVICISVTTRN
uniref:Uncharacterized protein n=1 Tax=Globisporangium ultimum (strain ATCC 200006 / CBS 805.95 / DAOM BR144) TaxID=431595 RepID=K3WSA5_GLOUD